MSFRVRTTNKILKPTPPPEPEKPKDFLLGDIEGGDFDFLKNKQPQQKPKSGHPGSVKGMHIRQTVVSQEDYM